MNNEATCPVCRLGRFGGDFLTPFRSLVHWGAGIHPPGRQQVVVHGPDSYWSTGHAGIKRRPSTRCFGNPALGSQFITSNPRPCTRLAGATAGAARRSRRCLGHLHGLRLDRPASWHHRSWSPVHEASASRLRSRRASKVTKATRTGNQHVSTRSSSAPARRARRSPSGSRAPGARSRSSSASGSAAPASTPAACRPRRWWRAPTPRIWRAARADYGVDVGGPVTRRHEARQGAQGRGRGHAPAATLPGWLRGTRNVTVHRRPRALRIARPPCGSATRLLEARADLHQRRRPRARAADAGPGRRPLSHQLVA